MISGRDVIKRGKDKNVERVEMVEHCIEPLRGYGGP